ncbi:MAG TPA: response regulator transcription factor, partial [Turneriella sp.]|nr:response regulator transcription factor [Turneriella sp.]
NGYIMKDTPPARFLSELEVIAQGGSTLTPRVAEKILRHFAPHKATESSLSKRELQVLNLISLGLRYEDIAEELDISVHTVRHHIEKIYKKLNVTSRGQAVAQAVRAGIIRLE